MWYRRAADRDSSPAIFNLAKMYEEGRGERRDLGQARILYQRAAGLGDSEAGKWLAQHSGR